MFVSNVDLLDNLQSFLHKNPDALSFGKVRGSHLWGPHSPWQEWAGLAGICQNLHWPILLILPVAFPTPTGGRVGRLDLTHS